MSKHEKFKAAFLTKKNLAKRSVKRANEALARLDDADALALELSASDKAAADKRIKALRKKVQEQTKLGTTNPGAAWVGLGELAPEIEKEIGLLRLQAKQAGAADAQRVAAELLAATRQALAGARNGCRALAVKRNGRKVASQLSDEVDTLSAKVDQAAAEDPPSLDTLRERHDEAKTLLKSVRKAGGRPSEPRTQAAASQVVVTDLGEIPAFGKRLKSGETDAQGRTAREDVEQRLAVFDQHYATDTDDEDDPDAGVRNQAMRLAAMTSVMAGRAGAELNDPYLVPRIGQSMVNEYAPELRASLTRGADSDEEADRAIRLAQALVMEDPIGKLMLGKMNPADAVQCIRDMAEVGQVASSQMLAMLRQQFEMKMASLTLTRVKAGEKPKDAGADGDFHLADITGELSPAQFSAMFATAGDDAAPARTGDDSGLAFKAAAGQVHSAVKTDTFGTMAQTYLGDANRWAEIRDANQVLVLRADATKGKKAVEQQIDLRGLGKDVALQPGLKLSVPGKLSLLDQLAPYVEAWDEEDDENSVDEAGARKPKTPKNKKKAQAERDEDSPSPLSAITPAQLRAAVTNLKSPRDLDPQAIQVPGLGQEHQVRAPLGEGKRSDAEALHGQINQKQYAHLRLLARADTEDRDAVLARTGKSVEDHVLEKLKSRYGIDDSKARKIADSVQGWIAKVPLTITFNGARVFSDASKNAPAFGEKFKSEVELSRGREGIGDVVGRAEQDGGAFGSQGGSKTVTGWKERGDNYMRWRRDKDSREARKDELNFDDQQIYGAANPTFERTKGDTNPRLQGEEAPFGKNYYGDAHFLLKDSVRNRCAFIVRTDSGQVNVQRQDVSMLVYDMLTKPVTEKGTDAKFMDAMLQIATGATTLTTGLTWEVHLYGGFDSSKDAQAIYLSSAVAKDAAERIKKFAKKHGIACEEIGAMPPGLKIRNAVAPKTIDLSSL